MPKLSQIVKSAKKPKFSTRTVNRCFRCEEKEDILENLVCVEFVLEKWQTREKIPGIKKSSW
jgi:ribosomal protein S14